MTPSLIASLLLAGVLALGPFCDAAPPRNRTIVELKRRLNTCDSRDRPISVGTTHLVYAYSTTTPKDDASIGYHFDTRGQRNLRLRDASPPSPVLPSDAKSVDFTFTNKSIPFDSKVTGPKTTYYCKTFPIPVEDKVHLIRAEPVITPGLYGVVHHMLTYTCNDLPENLIGWEGHCYDGTTPEVILKCNGGTVVSGWAVGGGVFDYPEEAGLPLGPKFVRFLLMEVHYNNPNQLSFVDSSGMRFTYTHELRANDAGILATGMTTDPALTIPPQTSSYTYSAYCPSVCTSKFNQPLTLLATLLHAHTSGKAIELRHIRNGIELEPILTDDSYDFNFQDFETYAVPKKLLPGDVLLTQCTYDTSSRDDVTHFGLSTAQEMCLAYTVYFPALPQEAGSCLFDNTTSIGELAVCGDSNPIIHPDIPRDFVPYTSNCTYIPPPPGRTNATLSLAPFDPSKFKRKEVMDVDAGSSHYLLYWNVDEEEQEIHLALDLDTTSGWLGFGISADGFMPGSDVSINYIADDGSLHHADRYADEHALPGKDPLQDYYDITFYTERLEPKDQAPLVELD